MSNIREIVNWLPLNRQDIAAYLKKIVPPIDPSQVNLKLLIGDERQELRTPTTGTLSLLLSYKQREAIVMSLDDASADLSVLQLQGARSRKSYRLASGINWVELFAHQADRIAYHPLSTFTRLVMPAPYAISGLLDEIALRETAAAKYLIFASIAGMGFSRLENMYVKDINKR